MAFAGAKLKVIPVRARNLKPGFFKNEELADIEPPWGRILFAGLWCLADREGRTEDRPRRIKAEIFPYDEKIPSIEKILSQLSTKSFIVRYSVDGEKFIQINKFKVHQNPHNTERQSTIPSPPINGELTVNSPLSNGGKLADSLIHSNHESLNPDSLNKDMSLSATPPTPKKSSSKNPKNAKTPLPDNFQISEGVLAWAKDNNFNHLDKHLDAFKRKATMNGYVYVNWDMAFMEAIREDWAKIRVKGYASQEEPTWTRELSKQPSTN